MIITGIIGPWGLIAVITIYLLISLPALFLVLKYEKSFNLFLWLLIILFIPFIGSALYLLRYVLNTKPERS